MHNNVQDSNLWCCLARCKLWAGRHYMWIVRLFRKHVRKMKRYTAGTFVFVAVGTSSCVTILGPKYGKEYGTGGPAAACTMQQQQANSRSRQETITIKQLSVAVADKLDRDSAAHCWVQCMMKVVARM